MLSKNREIVYDSNKISTYTGKMAVALINYNGHYIAYDVEDGYQYVEEMQRLLETVDFYFKRSFSCQKNKELFPDYYKKIYPLGLNFHVTTKGNPIDHVNVIKKICNVFMHRDSLDMFTPSAFEMIPQFKTSDIKIIFYSRLWAPHDQNEDINNTRIEIIRSLRKKYGSNFFGGLENSELAMQLAPELVVDKSVVRRSNYLKQMKQADIGIATTGLHGSIGWKLAEYVAAGKAIVTEKLNYEVPNGFVVDNNYYTFSSADDCLDKIQSLINDPSKLYEMKMENYRYYQTSLRPDMLIKNTLKLVDEFDKNKMESEQGPVPICIKKQELIK